MASYHLSVARLTLDRLTHLLVHKSVDAKTVVWIANTRKTIDSHAASVIEAYMGGRHKSVKKKGAFAHLKTHLIPANYNLIAIRHDPDECSVRYRIEDQIGQAIKRGEGIPAFFGLDLPETTYVIDYARICSLPVFMGMLGYDVSTLDKEKLHQLELALSKEPNKETEQ